MIIGIPRETFAGEDRVALVPDAVSGLVALNSEIIVEPGAGTAAGFADTDYTERGAQIVADRDEVYARADVVLQVRTFGANPEAGRADLALTRSGQVIIGASDPLTAGPQLRELATTGATLFAMELIPRITRAQSMDILSSMATIAGYKAVLIAADALPRMFPLLMTAAGTLTPARVLIIGAGVAGLQAIATARRLGAVVQAYDVRPAVKEQIESLGAKFIELEIDAGDSEDAGGYAKAQDEAFYRRQREELAKVAGQNDVVVTTAAIPGQPSPLLITADAVRAMDRGSVIVDLASERGGNCELTRPGETVVEDGVQIMGPLNLPAAVPNHASQMYSHNISTFLRHLLGEEELQFDMEDEITRETLVMRDGQVVHPRIRESDSEGDH
ncbi:MAG: Re/Si-specific NAD(P)(+) transhydrogenase subunit alpha [Candidatus Latescibacteria bacterium]|jgi:NAD(P) transhydrogenase subunit alpha|nr:Re/Si-specific NAD(P)(+) transhydrogenase subunit alpha [Candidatus Latescibacterota bacterium]